MTATKKTATHGLLDPFDDAAAIATRLYSARTVLIVVIGAEQWCEKCRKLKPEFEKLAAVSETDVMLWFDLEEHQEFLGGYIPESLPEVLIYRNMQLISRSLLPDGKATSLLTAMREITDPAGEDPGIARRLVREDWT